MSHANNKAKHRFEPNLHTKRFWVDWERRFVTLRVSSKGIKLITALGIETVLRQMRVRGEKVEIRAIIKLVSTAGTGHYYTTTKNPKTKGVASFCVDIIR